MAESCETYIQSEDFADYIIKFAGDVEDIRRRFGAQCITVINAAFAVIQLPVSSMAAPENFAYNSIPKIYGLMDSTNMDVSGIRRLHNQPYLALRGEDTLVGIIDTGIDYRHSVFRQADGTTRIAAIWDQTIQRGSQNQSTLLSENSSQNQSTPLLESSSQNQSVSLSGQTGYEVPFIAYGAEYRMEDINRALASENPLEIVPSVDTVGHGTFMAGIAAGNDDPVNDFTGAAPLAQIVAVKLKPAKNYLKAYYRIPEDAVAYQETDIMMAVRYLQRTAVRLQKPIVIFIGLGTNSGDHSGNSYLSQYLDYIGNLRGICAVTAAGNEGNRATHYLGSLAQTGARESVEIRVDNDENGFVIEVWGRAPDLLAVGFKSPGGEQIEKIQPRYGQEELIDFLLDPTKIFVYYDLVEAVSGNPVIVIRFENPSAGIWTVDVYGENILYKDYHMWLPIGNFIKSGTYFLRPDPDITVTSPGDTQTSICTTAYNHYNGSIYVQASRGFTPESRVVPDIAAPGVNIFGPVPDNKFTRMSGTSVAAAHTAGAAALMLEWGLYRRNNLNMDTTEVKKMLIRGASRQTDIQYPSRIWGFGTLDVYSAFQYTSGV